MLAAGANRVGTQSVVAMAKLVGPSAPPLRRLMDRSLPVDGGQSPAATGY
jgi:hypothetical protein